MAYIIKAYRSAVGKAGRGGFSQYRSDDLAVDIIKYLMSQVPELDPLRVDDVIVGCANPEGEQGLQLGRQISLRALGQDIPGMTVNRYCASGLETEQHPSRSGEESTSHRFWNRQIFRPGGRNYANRRSAGDTELHVPGTSRW